MKHDRLRFFLWGSAAFAALAALGFTLLWTYDNVFNGALKDYFVSFIVGYDEMRGVPILNDAKLSSVASAAVVALALVLSATGSICAYLAHRRQRELLSRALSRAERAQTLAEREMQRKSDLITYLAHDLKTPLASVIAYLSLLAESPELSAAQRAKYTGVALDKAFRLERLTDELFEIIRFNLQTLSLDRERIRLPLMLSQLADEFFPMLLAQNKRVEVACQEGLEVYADPDKLARVFNNMLKNAAAYSRADSVIRIEAEADGGWIAVRVINEGDPIPKEKLDLIFEKFYRLDSSRSSATGGAGLGLAIAKEIVEAHGGTISARSDSRGTAFDVRIPKEAKGENGAAERRLGGPKK